MLVASFTHERELPLGIFASIYELRSIILDGGWRLRESYNGTLLYKVIESGSWLAEVVSHIFWNAHLAF